MAKLSTVNMGVPYRKNLMCNGNMSIAQRGTSFTGLGPGGTTYTLDRWYYTEANAPVGVFTLTQESGQMEAGLPFDYAMKIDCTTAEDLSDATMWQQLQYRIEAQDLQHLMYGTVDAKPMTFSFYTKGNVNDVMSICFTVPDGTRQYVKEVTFTGDGNWERISFTIPGDTSGTINNDNGVGFLIRLTLCAGSNNIGATEGVWAADSGDDASSNQGNLLDNTANEMYFTGFQLEVGDQVTEFEHRPYEDEIRMCQRYYYRLDHVAGDTPVGAGMPRTAGDAWHVVHFPVEMRDVPTLENSTASDFATYEAGGTFSNVTSLSLGDTDNNASIVIFTHSSSPLSTNRPSIGKVNTSGGYLGFDAEP